MNSLNKFNNKVKYLPNGFFSDLVNIDLSSIKKEKIILTVGRLGTYQKNTELLIEALISIEDSLDDWKIYLVGPITDDFKIWLNKKLISHQCLKEKIVITGNITDKAELCKIYAKASIFVLPSRYESWGLVICEAMNMANYIIATDCCDAFSDVLLNKNEIYGYIVDNENIESLRAGIVSVIDNIDDSILKARKGSIFVNQNFNWEILARKLDNYFDNI